MEPLCNCFCISFHTIDPKESLKIYVLISKTKLVNFLTMHVMVLIDQMIIGLNLSRK